MQSADAGEDGTYGGRLKACAWPPRPQDLSRVRMIAPEELSSWQMVDDEAVLAFNKPGDVVCHPSKAGPWSSLAGAVKAGCGLERAHLVFRLDRETSGVVLFAKDERWASILQRAMMARRVKKTYLAVLTLLSPLIWFTGWLYLFYSSWAAWGLSGLRLEWIATGHTLGAFLMLAFLISHLYLSTTGHKLTSQIKAMLTGWEDLGDEATPGKHS